MMSSLAHSAQPGDHRSLSGDNEQAWRLARADLSAITIIGVAIDGTVISWDETAEYLFAVPAGRAVGQSIFSVLPHLAMDHLPHLMAKACTGERGGPIESTRDSATGTSTVSITAAPIWDGAGGGVTGIALVARDITALARSREHQALLVDDLHHRMRNTLAIVQAIAVQVFETHASPQTVRAELLTRLAALSRSHKLLHDADWRGALLYDVLNAQVAPHCGGAADRCTLQGPAIHLKPEAALALGMALHELAANAAKYGAFSATEGAVEIFWRRTELEGRRWLEFSWREHDGPPVAPPQRRGLGSRLIEHGLAYELGGQAHLEFHPAGVRYSLTAPLAAMEAAQ
jgi:two-component system CheB/CheR fusion protein